MEQREEQLKEQLQSDDCGVEAMQTKGSFVAESRSVSRKWFDRLCSPFKQSETVFEQGLALPNRGASSKCSAVDWGRTLCILDESALPFRNPNRACT
jgi:hypothetical protein